MTALSILLRGSVHEKLRWTFNLYDINKDGYINKEVRLFTTLATLQLELVKNHKAVWLML